MTENGFSCIINKIIAGRNVGCGPFYAVIVCFGETRRSTVSERIRENKMGVMPVGKLLRNMSVPMMLAMLVQALYNVVDSYFVAKISQDALNAVGMSFPVQNLMIAVGVGTGVGVNALLSRSLGEKEFETANEAAGNGIFLSVISCLIFMTAGVAAALALLSAPDRHSWHRRAGDLLSHHLLRLLGGHVYGRHVRSPAPVHR